MSKNVKIIILAVVAAILVSALVFGISIRNNLFRAVTNRFNAEISAQSTKQAEFETDLQGIQNIRLDFVSEEISVVVTNEDKIRIEEASNRQLNNDELMVSSVNGDTFTAKSGHLKNWFVLSDLFNFGTIKVTLYVPASYQYNFDLSTVSGQMDAKDLKAKELKLNTTSGEIRAENIQATRMALGSISGEMSLRNVQSNTLEMGETSGTISLAGGGSFETVSAHSVSGEIMLDAQRMGKVDVGTTSGSVNVTAGEMPGLIKVGTVSGDVMLKLPENEGFTLKYNTTSGSASNDFAMVNGVYKNGRNSIEVGTTSGNLNIFKQ